jgi:small nuclear ribonucleoprotein (snRNP)-like protein
LIEHECTVDVELRNDIVLSGKLDFIDNNMCMWLSAEPQQIGKLPPQFAGLAKGFYVRGSAIRSIAMPTIESDIETLS